MSIIPPLGQGTHRFEELDQRDAISAIQYGIDQGITHIDTAAYYGDGQVEKLVGKAINNRRHDVFLATKVWPTHASYEGIQQSCNDSLDRLNTDHIDLYMLHWPSSYPAEEMAKSLLKLKEDGKIRYIGVSNFTVPLLEEIMPYMNGVPILANQVMYNLNERIAENHIFPYCQEHDIIPVAYSPLSSGADFTQNKELQALAEKYGKTPHQIALNFLSNEQSVCLIPRSTKKSNLLQIAQALDFYLEPGERETLSAAYPLRGPQDGVSIPILADLYFSGDYNRELKHLLEKPKLI